MMLQYNVPHSRYKPALHLRQHTYHMSIVSTLEYGRVRYINPYTTHTTKYSTSSLLPLRIVKSICYHYLQVCECTYWCSLHAVTTHTKESIEIHDCTLYVSLTTHHIIHSTAHTSRCTQHHTHITAHHYTPEHRQQSHFCRVWGIERIGKQVLFLSVSFVSSSEM